MKTESFLRKFLGAILLCVGLQATSHADTVNVQQQLTGTVNWSRTNIYTLNGAVFVMPEATLNIEAGTVIKGHNLGGQGTNVAALYVTRGAKIFAEGTPQNPIIFTADVDDTTIPDDVDIYARGLWGGVVVFGNAILNAAIDGTGNAQPLGSKYEVYEGLIETVLNGVNVFRFGGNDDNDNSGVLRYVSIRHGGAVLAANKEINGLSLGAVGRGTTIEFVETYATADDGFEFFGGTVNTRYLVSAFNDDDSFDTDMGYRGTNQFWFAIQPRDKRNYGMELNNHPNEVSQATQLTPAADFKVYNMTIIGSGATNTIVTGGVNAAIALRPWVGPKIYNSIFTDFNAQGVLADTQNGVNAAQAVTDGYAQLHNTLWWNFTTASGNGIIDNTATNLGRNSVTTNYWTDGTLTNQIANPMLTSITRTNDGTYLDPRPAAGSPAFSDYAATPNDGFLTAANYRGAFGANNLWIANWTALAEYGFLTQGTNVVNVQQQLTGTVNWSSTNIYMLNGAVFVMPGATLNIEAGTVIKGHNLGGQGTNVAALYVTRGAKIFAEGTPQNPIIFTAEVDDTTIPDDVDIYARGLWGGVVVFGNAILNAAIDGTGNAQPLGSKYEVYEGLIETVLNGVNVFRFGGNDDNDNSGVLRYVSIRHGGAVLAANKEINGLSLGAVGRGTTIEFVETYAIADDGFEFFGGTVNTRYLVSAFNDDDSFDTDMGYRGTNQFWFAIQPRDKRNYGMELNNHPNEVSQATQLTPAADFKVYNMTIIGSGATNTIVTGGVNAAIALRPWVGPKIYNSIFTDFNAQGVLADTQNGVNAAQAVTGGLAQLHNTLWWDFTTASGNGIIDNTATNLGRNSVTTNYWTDATLTNQIANPMLISISRTNTEAQLDPRPAAGSPALTDFAAAPAGLAAANYRGAFSANRGNWAADWTALSEYGVMGGAGGANPGQSTAPPVVATPTEPTITTARNGSNLDITFPTQSGFSYQLRSATTLTGAAGDWSNEGAAVAGTGNPVTIPVALTGDQKFVEVVVQ